MKLYEINDVYLSILELMSEENTDMEMLATAMKQVGDELETKAENYAKIIKQIEGDIETVKKEKDRLSNKQRAMENNVRWLKMNLQSAMELQGKTKFKTNLFVFSVQKNAPSLDDFDESIVPDAYWKVTRSIDRTALLKAVKNGEVEGIELKQTESLRIR